MVMFSSIRAVYNRYAGNGRGKYTSGRDSVGQEVGEESMRVGDVMELSPPLEHGLQSHNLHDAYEIHGYGVDTLCIFCMLVGVSDADNLELLRAITPTHDPDVPVVAHQRTLRHSYFSSFYSWPSSQTLVARICMQRARLPATLAPTVEAYLFDFPALRLNAIFPRNLLAPDPGAIFLLAEVTKRLFVEPLINITLTTYRCICPAHIGSSWWKLESRWRQVSYSKPLG